MKIFYKPITDADDTLIECKIMGMSDGDVTMEFPYLETDEEYHATTNLRIEIENGVPKLIITKG